VNLSCNCRGERVVRRHWFFVFAAFGALALDAGGISPLLVAAGEPAAEAAPAAVSTGAPAAGSTGAPATVSPGIAARTDARLGYDAYAVSNLISTPAVLAGEAAQSFVDATFAEMEARADGPLRARLRSVRELVRAAPGTFDPADAGRSFLAANRDLAATLDAEGFAGYELGGYVATVAFNARVLREEATDTNFRRAVGDLGALDASTPGLAAARSKLAADSPAAWETIANDADAVAALVLGAPPPQFRPAAHAVWALLVRGRPIAGDGPRGGALHTSLDIVYGDGAHRTIGAYPSGKYDFSATGGPLLCETDLEPAGGPSRAYALVAPKNVSYDTLADRFLKACTAFDKRRPHFTYAPSGEHGSSDNDFVAGLLAAESLELPQGL